MEFDVSKLLPKLNIEFQISNTLQKKGTRGNTNLGRGVTKHRGATKHEGVVKHKGQKGIWVGKGVAKHKGMAKHYTTMKHGGGKRAMKHHTITKHKGGKTMKHEGGGAMKKHRTVWSLPSWPRFVKEKKASSWSSCQKRRWKNLWEVVPPRLKTKN